MRPTGPLDSVTAGVRSVLRDPAPSSSALELDE